MSPGPTRLDTTAVLLIAHGSRNARANQDLFELAERLLATRMYPIVESCFLELAEPDIATGGENCVAKGATRVLMVPYFLSMGVHLVRDLARARDDLASRHPEACFALGNALGPDPLLDLLVSYRLQELDTRTERCLPFEPRVEVDGRSPLG